MGSMVIESHDVVLSRVIKVGENYFIAPSEGFPGIVPGVSTVMGIFEWNSLNEADREQGEYYLQDSDEGYAKQLQSEPWVLWNYVGSNDPMDLMPISVFAHHVVPRY